MASETKLTPEAILWQIWNTLTTPLRSLVPILDSVSQAYAAIFNPIWACVARTKMLEGGLGTFSMGMIILGLTLLSIRLFVLTNN